MICSLWVVASSIMVVITVVWLFWFIPRIKYENGELFFRWRKRELTAYDTLVVLLFILVWFVFMVLIGSIYGW